MDNKLINTLSELYKYRAVEYIDLSTSLWSTEFMLYISELGKLPEEYYPNKTGTPENTNGSEYKDLLNDNQANAFHIWLKRQTKNEREFDDYNDSDEYHKAILIDYLIEQAKSEELGSFPELSDHDCTTGPEILDSKLHGFIGFGLCEMTYSDPYRPGAFILPRFYCWCMIQICERMGELFLEIDDPNFDFFPLLFRLEELAQTVSSYVNKFEINASHLFELKGDSFSPQIKNIIDKAIRSARRKSSLSGARAKIEKRDDRVKALKENVEKSGKQTEEGYVVKRSDWEKIFIEELEIYTDPTKKDYKKRLEKQLTEEKGIPQKITIIK